MTLDTGDGSAVRLVRGRWVVTGAEDDDRTLEDAAVVVRGDRIEAVGAWKGLRDRHPGAEVLGSPGAAVMPGLVDAHHHSHGITSVATARWGAAWPPWHLASSHAPGRECRRGPCPSPRPHVIIVLVQ